ncbi:MAG: beta-glucosidase, partial [Candidatus Neomarinimicrobiota bacterium]
VGSEAHRQVARQAVRESLVLLKNENQLLPLSKAGLKIHVAGANADDLGHQCGGWTITWQGGSGDITPGTTIYEAIRQSVDDPGLVTYSADGSGAAGSDVAVVVIGEGSYAEMEGDRDDLHLSAADQETLARVKQAGLPMVVILISGRPLIITDELPDWQACIAAWYPGTEGQGVADVLFGDYNPTGTLSVSWPRSMDQIPINIGDEPYDPLFPFGFGLRY